MNVYVESNFILELALTQEQCESCEGILSLCESGSLRLLVPAWSLAEPYETLARRHRERTQLRTTLEREAGQLARTAAYSDRVPEVRRVVGFLASSANEEIARLEDVRSRLLEAAEVIALETDVLRAIVGYRKALSPQDALVYASVLSSLRRTNPTRSCFLDRDLDFKEPDLIAELESYGCKLLPSFDDGYGYLRSALSPTPRPSGP